MQKYGYLDMASWAVSALGATFFGMKAFGFDPFRDYFGRDSTTSRMLYTMFGLAGLLSLFQFFSYFRWPEDVVGNVRNAWTDMTQRTTSR